MACGCAYFKTVNCCNCFQSDEGVGPFGQNSTSPIHMYNPTKKTKTLVLTVR